MTTTTEAEAIADQFGEDGLCWEAEDGQDLETVLRSQSVSVDHRDGRGVDGPVRYTMYDGSCIVTTSAAWDVGMSAACYCWAGVGHDDNCATDGGAA